MPMAPFVTRFRELGTQETRTLTVQDHPVLPRGAYGFFEFYCNEPGCDCRRVVICVMRPETGWEKMWATIGYGWESEEFYQKKVGGSFDAGELKGPFLEPLSQQTEYSAALLELFQSTVLPSPDYVDRLKRHYRMFRDAIEAEDRGRSAMEARRVENRRMKHRDPKRRRR